MARRPRIPHEIRNEVEYKHCSKCDEWYPLTNFTKDRYKWDGLNGWCKHCNKKYDDIYVPEHKEEKRAYDKQYCIDNADIIKKKRRQYYQAKKEKWKQYRQAKQVKN